MRDPYPLVNRPIRLNWAGWQSDTATLQQHGWSFSAEQNIAAMQMRLAMRHERHQIFGLTAPMDYDFMGAAYCWDHHSQFEMPIQFMASRLTAQIMENRATAFAPIDCQPMVIPERRIERIEDFAHFAPPLVRTQEIILPEEDVGDLLDRILKMQQPDRIARIKDKMRHEPGRMIDAVPRQKFHAQILSIAA